MSTFHLVDIVTKQKTMRSVHILYKDVMGLRIEPQKQISRKLKEQKRYFISSTAKKISPHFHI